MTNYRRIANPIPELLPSDTRTRKKKGPKQRAHVAAPALIGTKRKRKRSSKRKPSDLPEGCDQTFHGTLITATRSVWNIDLAPRKASLLHESVSYPAEVCEIYQAGQSQSLLDLIFTRFREVLGYPSYFEQTYQKERFHVHTLMAFVNNRTEQADRIAGALVLEELDPNW